MQRFIVSAQPVLQSKRSLDLATADSTNYKLAALSGAVTEAGSPGFADARALRTTPSKAASPQLV